MSEKESNNIKTGLGKSSIYYLTFFAKICFSFLSFPILSNDFLTQCYQKDFPIMHMFHSFVQVGPRTSSFILFSAIAIGKFIGKIYDAISGCNL